MEFIYNLSRRKVPYIIVDISIILSSYFISYFLRFYPGLDTHLHFFKPVYFILLVTSYLIIFYLSQIYKIIWAYSNIKDVYKLGFANIGSFITVLLIILIFIKTYSRLVFILTFFLILIGTIFYRVLLRDYFSKWKDKNNVKHSPIEQQLKSKKILIIGAGESGRTILAELLKKGLRKNVVGFIDDDPEKIGKIFNGKKIFAGTEKIEKIISNHKITEIIIAMPSVDSVSIKEMVTNIKENQQNISIKILPPIIEILGNRPLIGSLREIGIDDLIGREEVTVDIVSIEKSFNGKIILVTGAGGSIGSEICRQLLKFNIKKLIAIDREECSIYNLVKNLHDNLEYLPYKPQISFKIVDVKDSFLIDNVFRIHEPDVVFHAAAHKHVPLLEYNEAEALYNNVYGTLQLLKSAKKYNIENFILISTDKAVNPTSIMGASKRIAELITLYYNKEKELKNTIVRFGNVIGSRGSVIPLFQEQINKGGPVTVTHPDMQRYFMTISEASILVINAAAYSKGGEIFVLDMGQQHKIVDIARNLMMFYGYEPEKDIKITYTGLRPGEKLYEELYYKRENFKETGNEKIFVLNTDGDDYKKKDIEKIINIEFNDIAKYNSMGIRKFIKNLIKEYNYDNLYAKDFHYSKFVN